MSFVAISAVVVAGTAAYGTYSASQGPDDPSAVFGKKPKISPYIPIDLAEEQKKAAASNLTNLDSITELLNKMDPGFSDLIKSGLDTSGALMRGELPQEVIDTLMRHSAEMSIEHGDAGTQGGGFRSLRDLGIGTLEGMRFGGNNAQLWTKIARENYSPFLITTEDQTAAAAANNAGEQRTQQNINNVNAAPDPAAAGMFNYDQAQNAALQQSLGQITSSLSTLGRQYAQQQPQGSWSRPYVGRSYVYDPASGSYVLGGG